MTFPPEFPITHTGRVKEILHYKNQYTLHKGTRYLLSNHD